MNFIVGLLFFAVLFAVFYLIGKLGLELFEGDSGGFFRNITHGIIFSIILLCIVIVIYLFTKLFITVGAEIISQLKPLII